MAITGWGNFRPLSALSLDAGPLPTAFPRLVSEAERIELWVALSSS